ncbi:hypothetical protein N7451_012220 [Penicillium sp. IBT 35674x]|nr:hypothetical protein N7451_012220 [Penicillium sp. IBT 35674x]
MFATEGGVPLDREDEMGEEGHLVLLDHPVDPVATVAIAEEMIQDCEGVTATVIHVLTQPSKVIALVPQVSRGITCEYIRTTATRELVVE